jgi:hypothetical protein
MGFGVWSVEAVFVCALGLLGRSEQTFPPVDFVSQVPPGVSRFAQGYVHAPDAHIVLVTSSAAFADARRTVHPCTDVAAIREIASVLAHEEWHVRHGPDEEAAYDAQLTALLFVGAGQGSPLYDKVFRAKQAVVAAARRSGRARLIARDGQ